MTPPRFDVGAEDHDSLRPPARVASFDPEPSSVRAARAFVLDGADLTADQAFTVELLVSEVAANAVLHAQTEFTVRVTTATSDVPDRPERLRIEVEDTDPSPPEPKTHSLDAPTGRGLRILESLADEWGTVLHEVGKTVWFEVTVEPQAGAVDSDAAPAEAADLVDVHFLGLPVALRSWSQEHYDGLLREIAVVRTDHRHEAVPRRLLSLMDDLDLPFRSVVGAAGHDERRNRDGTRASVDVTYRVPVSAADDARLLGEILDEVDEYCRAGSHLLTPPAPPALVRYRRWFLQEMVGQIGGAPPKPWTETVDGARERTSAEVRGGPADDSSSTDQPILTLSGDLDLRSSGAVRDALATMHADHRGPATIDLRSVPFIDSVGISVLAAAHNRFSQDGRTLVIILPDHLRPLFEITGLDNVFTLVPA